MDNKKLELSRELKNFIISALNDEVAISKERLDEDILSHSAPTKSLQNYSTAIRIKNEFYEFSEALEKLNDDD